MTTSSAFFPSGFPHRSKTGSFMPTLSDRRPYAVGLYLSHVGRNLTFEAMRARSKGDVMAIGTGRLSTIRLPEGQGQRRHALLEHRSRMMYIMDNTEDHDTFIDGWQLIKPVPILVGMVIKIGSVNLIGTNRHGRFPITGETLSEYCRNASDLAGGHRAAGRLVGRSHNFIRNQFKPREERYGKATEESCSNTN